MRFHIGVRVSKIIVIKYRISCSSKIRQWIDGEYQTDFSLFFSLNYFEMAAITQKYNYYSTSLYIVQHARYSFNNNFILYSCAVPDLKYLLPGENIIVISRFKQFFTYVIILWKKLIFIYAYCWCKKKKYDVCYALKLNAIIIYMIFLCENRGVQVIFIFA